MHLRRSLSALALVLVSAPTLALAEGPEGAKPAAPEPSTEYEGRVSFVFRPSFPVSNGNVFAYDGRLPAPMQHTLHHINTGAARPSRARLRRYSILEMEALWKEVDRLLRTDVIEPANSP